MIGLDRDIDAISATLMQRNVFLDGWQVCRRYSPIQSSIQCNPIDEPQCESCDWRALDDGFDHATAEEDFLAAVRKRPSLPDAAASLGVLYQRQGRVAEAEREIAKAIALNPLGTPFDRCTSLNRTTGSLTCCWVCCS